MYYTKGVFGVLNLESLPGEPMILLDGGIESRYKEGYFFDNSCRSNYHGYLFQYTLSGCGAYESNGKTIFLTPGTAFFAAIPEKSCYYLPEKTDEPWKFLYLHCFFFPPSLLFSQYRSRHQSDAVYQLLLQVPLGHAQ